MNRCRFVASSRGRLPRRLVAAGLAVALVALVAFALTPLAPARAQVDITIDPQMTKGPASAPVTIVEFSDYQ